MEPSSTTFRTLPTMDHQTTTKTRRIGYRMKRQSFDILKSQRKATDNGPKKGNQPMDIRQELIGPLAKQNEEKGNTSRRGQTENKITGIPD